jgi:hypothetical protein
MAMTAMGAEDGVVGPELRAHAHGNGFLSDVSVAGAVDESLLVRAGQLLLAAADELHRPI